MQLLKPVLLVAVALSVLSCTKQAPDAPASEDLRGTAPIAASPAAAPAPGNAPSAKKILIDATRDGGVWWYPQYEATGFSASEHHQGKALADYLRGLGYQVDELGRGISITSDLLSKYDKVIRAGGAGSYSTSELAAYDAFLSRPSALLLIQDHQKNFPNDALSRQLNLPFTGAQAGTVTRFNQHAITEGVESHAYIAGSVIPNPDPNRITVLGTLSYGADSTQAAAMGILHHPASRIFFIGDINGLEQVPQPLTGNLVKWLFE